MRPSRAVGRRRATLSRAPTDAPPELLIVLAALSVQGGGGIAAQLLTRHGVPLVVSLRIVLAALVMLVWRPPRRNGADPRAWRYAIALGVALAAMNSLFYLSITRIPRAGGRVPRTLDGRHLAPALRSSSGAASARSTGWSRSLAAPTQAGDRAEDHEPAPVCSFGVSPLP